MKTGHMIFSAAAILPLLSGCSAYMKLADSDEWNIKPIFNVRHSTETPESYYQLGRYYYGQNRYEQALDAYQKALAIDGTFAEARNGLGVIYSMQGRQQESIEQFRLAVQQVPNAAHFLNNLGYALYLGGSYAEAASALEQAVAIDPANQAASANLVLALDKAGDKERSVQIVAQAAGQQFSEKVQPTIQEAQQVRARMPISVSVPDAVTATSSPQAQQLWLKSSEAIMQAVRPSVGEQQARATAPASKPYRIGISNGNGVTGMARKVAGFFEEEGYFKTRLTNQKPFNVVSSQVQYRFGYREQAQSLALSLPGKPGIIQSDNLRADINIRILLGKDVAGKVAYFEQGRDTVHLAHYGSDS